MNVVSSSLKDFKDWISPIIVKELRQGMRTKVFTAAFIVLQGFMVLFILIGWNQDRTAQSEDASGFFWGCVFITLVLVMPLRGFGALSSEVRLDTMDLISLTRLSAWRITAGKWAALVSQSILVAIAVLPYVVLRYFFGGVNLFAELIFLGMALLMSCLLSAVMVGLSAFTNFLVRGVLAVTAAVGSLTAIIQFIALSQRMPDGIPFSDVPGFGFLYLGIILGSIFLMYYFLDMGATRMAPEAINHSTRKRLISILFLLAVLSIPIIFAGVLPAEPFYILGSALIGLFALDALTERPSGVRSLHKSFARGGPLGWLFQLFFAPGWFTGLFYVFVLGGMLFGAELIFDAYATSIIQNLTLHVSFIGMLVFPLLVIHLFYPDLKDFFAAYFFIQCAAFAVGGCLSIIDGSVSISAIMWAGCPLPFVSYLMAWQGYDSNAPALLALSSITLLITTLVCLIRGASQIGFWKKVRIDLREQQNESS